MGPQRSCNSGRVNGDVPGRCREFPPFAEAARSARLIFLAISGSGVRAFECALSSRTSSLVHGVRWAEVFFFGTVAPGRATVTHAPRAKSWSRRTYAIPRSGVTAEGTRLYRASKLDCDVCALKARCCPNAVARKIPRDLNEDSRDIARALASTSEYETACRRRKKIEMLFAHLKRILRLARLRLRGPNGARDEFLLAATAQNLRRLARLRPMNMLPEVMFA